MKPGQTLIPVALAALSLGACATDRDAAGADEVSPQMAAEDARLLTYRIENWSAPSNEQLIVESIDGTRYLARFATDCIGLQFTTSIAFVTRGVNQLDDFSGIVLPDGTRCYFRSFERIPSPAQAADDDA